MRDIVLIIHNVRSAHNVGSLLRTADGCGVKKVILSGYTPYPKLANDPRLPHLATATSRKIAKTALGAENYVLLEQTDDIIKVIDSLKKDGYNICAIEQHPKATPLNSFKGSRLVALIAGNEVDGIEATVLELCDQVLEIPMLGHKESLNVVQAVAMALYHCRFIA